MAMATVRRRAVWALAVLAVLCGCCFSVCGATSPNEEVEVMVQVDVSCLGIEGKLSWRVSGKSDSEWTECSKPVNYDGSPKAETAGAISSDSDSICSLAGSKFEQYSCNPTCNCSAVENSKKVAFTMDLVADNSETSEVFDQIVTLNGTHYKLSGILDTCEVPDSTPPADERTVGEPTSGEQSIQTPPAALQTQPQTQPQPQPQPQTKTSQSSQTQTPQPQTQTETSQPPQTLTETPETSQTSPAAPEVSSSVATQQDGTSASGSEVTETPAAPAAEQSVSTDSTEPQGTFPPPNDAEDPSKATGDSGADGHGGTQAPSTSAEPSGTSASNTPAGSDGESATTATTSSSPSGGKHTEGNADGSGTPTVWVRGTLLLLLTAALACAAGE
ncbi:mucin-like glycoprotein [Trypanosoma rangeli]|uniref:Mucin-like glycoprotein n=1 Tax=Trypanosoma rangeli TaxID=5698 RepID=A0A3R7K7K0_TRYRA|nr:mucin-like glycoprotein [Trypanosoma rangeli]RNE95403.1 mucin-like glycoprotein [Trypanosoma rangeli]|eukprot:RNE95403.1 mucin-like glycoprotein [Trypanosoma rangeli]